MQFSKIAAVLGFAAAATAAAVPNGGSPSACESGKVLCLNGGAWSSNTQNCQSGGSFCCATAAVLGLIQCNNILNPQTSVQVPISIVGPLL